MGAEVSTPHDPRYGRPQFSLPSQQSLGAPLPPSRPLPQVGSVFFKPPQHSPTDSARTHSSLSSPTLSDHGEPPSVRHGELGASTLIGAWERAGTAEQTAPPRKQQHHWQLPWMSNHDAKPAPSYAARGAQPAPGVQASQPRPQQQQQQESLPKAAQRTTPRGSGSSDDSTIDQASHLDAARAIFARQVEARANGEPVAKRNFTFDSTPVKSWKTWESVRPAGKDSYKMGRFDVVTTQLFGKDVKKPDVVCSSMSVYRGIDEELAEMAALEALEA